MASSDRASKWALSQPLWVLLVAVAASLGVVAVLESVPYFPTHDGPQHIYSGHLTNHYSDPGTPYAEFYRPTHSLAALGFNLLYTPLADALPWRSALRAALALILLVWSWGFVNLVHAVRRERLWLGILGFAVAFQWALFMGFFSYLLSLGIGLSTIALALRHERWLLRHRLAIAGLLFLQAVLHAFGAQVTAVFLVVLVLTRSERARWPRELFALAVMGLPVALVLAYALGLVGESGPLPRPDTSATLSAWERLQLIRGVFVGGPAWRGWPPVLLAVAGVALTLRRHRAGLATREERALAITAALLLATGLLAPMHLPSWELFSPRFLPFGVMLALPLLPVEALRQRWASAAAALGVTLFAAGSLVWAATFSRETYRRCAAAFDGLDAPVHRNGFRLPLILDSTCGAPENLAKDPIPYFAPAGNLGALYAVAQGGMVPYTFAVVPQLHPFVMTKAASERLPPAPPRSLFWSVYENPETRLPPEQRFAITTQLALDGSRFEDVLFHGPEEELRVFLNRGYRADYSRGRMAILRFEGCPTRVSVKTPGADRHRVLAELTWFPGTDYLPQPPLPPEAFDQNGAAMLPLTRTPCGLVRLRVFADVDGSAGFSKPDLRCRGSEADGTVVLRIRPETRQFDCDLLPPGG